VTDPAADVFVHPQGLCESSEVGPGTRVWAFAHVMEGARVGRACNLGDHSFVESGAVVGDRVTVKNGVMIWDRVCVEDDVFLGPGMVFTNDRVPRRAFRTPPEQLVPTFVKRGASIGAQATLVCGVTIGEGALVGAGSVVLEDVPAYGLVVGNPAHRVGWVCLCGERLGDSLACPCGRRYRLQSEKLGLAAIPDSP
jgi:acetyltransferase-like isoleucine patch superfamily enzyme